MMKCVKIFALLVGAALLASCGNKKTGNDDEQYTVKVAVDETFRPIMEQEMKVFNAKFPEAIMKPIYGPETDIVNLLLKDSVRTIITTRPLTKKEIDGILKVYKLRVLSQTIAYDAVALIVNKNNPDTLISTSEIRAIMTGKKTRWEQIQHAKTKGNIEVVFDNENSSTVRFVRDSVCAGDKLYGKMKSAKTSQDVLKYVAQTRNAIGIIGVDWLRNQKDSTNLSFDKRIRVMSVSLSSVTEPGNCFQPVQYYIATGDYPLTRALYVITTDPRSTALAMNFYYFLSDSEGQLIITKSSQLLPYMPVQVKQVEVK